MAITITAEGEIEIAQYRPQHRPKSYICYHNRARIITSPNIKITDVKKTTTEDTINQGDGKIVPVERVEVFINPRYRPRVPKPEVERPYLGRLHLEDHDPPDSCMSDRVDVSITIRTPLPGRLRLLDITSLG